MRYEFFPWRMVRSPGEENGNPLQYPCLENPMEGGTWWATVLRFTKSQTWLSDLACMLTKCSWENSVTSGAFLVGTCANGRKLYLPSSTYSASIPQVCFFPQAQGLKFPLTLLHSASPSSSHSQWLAINLHSESQSTTVAITQYSIYSFQKITRHNKRREKSTIGKEKAIIRNDTDGLPWSSSG